MCSAPHATALAILAHHEEVAQVLVRLAERARQHVAVRRPEVDQAVDRLDVVHSGTRDRRWRAGGERGVASVAQS